MTGAGTLTQDQRWLLFGVGGWPMVWCLAEPQTGIPHLMQSMLGSTNGRPASVEDAPEWLEGGYRCGGGKIVSPGYSDQPARCTVTAKEIAAFAETIPPAVRTGLRANKAEGTRLAILSASYCHCPRQDCAAYWGPASIRIHPTDEQEADLRAQQVAHRRNETLMLHAALRVFQADAEPEQLDLFGVAS